MSQNLLKNSKQGSQVYNSLILSNPRQEIRLFRKPDWAFKGDISTFKTNRWAEMITGSKHYRRHWDDDDFDALIALSFTDNGRFLCECGRFFDEPFGASNHGIWQMHCPHCGGRSYKEPEGVKDARTD